MGENHCSGEREGYGRHNGDVQGEPAAAEACISCYSLRWVMHSLRGIAPGHGFLGSTGLHSLPGRCGQWPAPAHSLVETVMAITPTSKVGDCSHVSPHLWHLWKCRLAVWECTELEGPLDSDLSLWQARAFSGIPKLCYTGPLRLSSWQSTPVLSLESLNLSTQWPPNPSGHADKHFRLGSAGRHWSVCRSISNSPSTHLLLHSPLRFWSAHPCPHPWDVYECAETFLPSELPPWGTGSFLIALSLPLSFFPLYLLPYPISLTFWKSEVFWQHSVGVL